MKELQDFYTQMVTALRNTTNYREYREVEKQFLSDEYIQNNTEAGTYSTLESEDTSPSFRFFHGTLPTQEMIDNAKVEIDVDKGMLIMPNYVRKKVYFDRTSSGWKYSLDNEFEAVGNF
jgi:hypothetical protein